MKLLGALLLFTATSFGQDYSQRGFIETRLVTYPQKAPNDSAHTVGETLFRYEGFYTPSSSIQFSGAIDIRTDTHHQVERAIHLSWQDRELKRPVGAVRRLSANYHSGPLTVEIGKQFVRWGKTDILTPTDRFAPRDFLTVVDNEFVPVAAARVTLENGPDTLDFVYSPWLTPSRTPLPDQRWFVAPVGLQTPELSTRFPGGPQLGARWNHTGAVEYSASFYEGFNNLPSFSPDLSRFYPRMRMAGGDLALPLRWLTLKGEAGFFTSSDERADDYILYVVQLERQAGEWFLVGGYAGEVVTEEGRLAFQFAPDRGFTKTILARAGYTIDANRSVAFESAVRQNGAGAWARFEYSRAFGQHWRATVNFTLVRGDRDDFIGQYNRNSHVGVVARYSF